jgi:Domain of unknown function (DUF4198)
VIRALLLIACAPLAFAHDFWIEPSTFQPAAATTITASLRVGEDFAGDPVPRSAALVERFVVRDAASERPVIGIENRDPAGFVRVGSGTSVIHYRSKASTLEQTPEKFAQFLAEEGLEHVARASGRVQRERFYRFAKTIVGRGAGFDATFGDRLELVPLLDPRTSDIVSMRLLFEGKPLSNALVTAIARDDGRRICARTDRGGNVALGLPRNDVWLVKSTHLVAAGNEWESLWASVTFSR